MTPKRPIEFFSTPRVWPAVAISTGAALGIWGLELLLGHGEVYVISAVVAFWLGPLVLLLGARQRIGIILLSYPLRVFLLRLSVGLCWGAVVFVLLFARWSPAPN